MKILFFAVVALSIGLASGQSMLGVYQTLYTNAYGTANMTSCLAAGSAVCYLNTTYFDTVAATYVMANNTYNITALWQNELCLTLNSTKVKQCMAVQATTTCALCQTMSGGGETACRYINEATGLFAAVSTASASYDTLCLRGIDCPTVYAGYLLDPSLGTCLAATSGCTHPTSYWATNNVNHTGTDDWPLSETTLLCDEEWEVIINDDSSKEYDVLSREYIAARLNQANNASVPPLVGTSITAAGLLLNGLCGLSISDGEADELAAIASILQDYNNGVLGPGICSGDKPDSKPTPRYARAQTFGIAVAGVAVACAAALAGIIALIVGIYAVCSRSGYGKFGTD